ncbi:MAG: MBL fold metallo-hydrolase, partial [bacterium]|nr:MBL fold metallo-hydrolase [bacterium]
MAAGYRLRLLVQGYPGKAASHGALGWSSIALLEDQEHRVLVDCGSFGVRPLLLERLRACGLEPQHITDVLLTHAHWDHAVNWTLFPLARVC